MPRVLTIDDDPVIRMIVNRVLGAAGVVTDEATNGAEGISKAQTNPPDLILCDLDMPVMDGIETLAATRQDPILQCIPFVLITGVASPADEQRMLGGGAIAVLRKPFPFSALQEIARKYLHIP